MAKPSLRGFYYKLAWGNVRRSREVYLPYAIATAIMAGVYFLIFAMMHSPGLDNFPSGGTTKMMLAMGGGVFTLFVFGFMVYINGFLIKRRKREFGLYGVLGLGKRHIARILRWENFFVIGGGVAIGVLLGMLLGRLLHMLLLNMIHVAGESRFILPPIAFGSTFFLFLGVYVFVAVYNSIKVRLANPADLLKSDNKGERIPRRVLPGAILGAALLFGAYYVAIAVEDVVVAMALFFLAVLAVIIATYLLFHSGSIAVLRLLRANKRIYYKLDNFVAISGMFHRMRQNASGLATICILSTMLLVTVSGSLSLYTGQEEIAKTMYPLDVTIGFARDERKMQTDALLLFDEALGEIASANGVTAAYDESVIQYRRAGGVLQQPGIQSFAMVDGPEEVALYDHMLVLAGNTIAFNLTGKAEACREAISLAKDRFREVFKTDSYMIRDVFSYRESSYGLFGGLLFLGAFFAVLFLAVTVLIIYFKQVTEGYEDKARFAILQKVGMDKEQVRRTINRQILWVFFLPLGAALCHTLIGGVMVTKMLQAFSLYNGALTFTCILVSCGVFAIAYLFVYQRTAKVYYRIVKW